MKRITVQFLRESYDNFQGGVTPPKKNSERKKRRTNQQLEIFFKEKSSQRAFAVDSSFDSNIISPPFCLGEKKCSPSSGFLQNQRSPQRLIQEILGDARYSISQGSDTNRNQPDTTKRDSNRSVLQGTAACTDSMVPISGLSFATGIYLFLLEQKKMVKKCPVQNSTGKNHQVFFCNTWPNFCKD